MKSAVNVDLKKNWLILTFEGVVTKRDIERIYTDVRFGVSDLKPHYNVIADFSGCLFMYLNCLKTFKKLFHYMLTSNSGEIIRVLHPKRIIARQIINYTLHRPGYKPTYVATRNEAEKKITSAAKRTAIRFQLHEKPTIITANSVEHEGFILNISQSGCAMSSKTLRPKVGDTTSVRFTLKAPTSTREFKLQARVVRVESYTFAVQFNSISEIEDSFLWACLLAETEDMPI